VANPQVAFAGDAALLSFQPNHPSQSARGLSIWDFGAGGNPSCETVVWAFDSHKEQCAPKSESSLLSNFLPS
jgi:hypothetical protein